MNSRIGETKHPNYQDYQPDYHSIHTFFLYLDALNITYLIVSLGGMATKSAVESILMKRHDITRATAHDILNQIEEHNINCKLHPVPRPLLSKYPEIFQVRVPHLTTKRNRQ